MKRVTIDNNQPLMPNTNSIPLDMMGEMMNSDIPEENIIDAEVSEIENATVNEDTIIEVSGEAIVGNNIPFTSREISTATPFQASIITSGNKRIGTIYFLCKDTEEKLFVLERNYILENEEDELAIECLPFTEQEDDFASVKITRHLLCTTLDCFVSDFKFSINDGFEKDSDPKLWFEVINTKTKVTENILISADTFACIAFIDSYVFEGITNEHDFRLATVVASKILESPAEFFLVDKVESIVSMAPAEVEIPGSKLSKIFKRKKVYDTTLGIAFKVSKFISNTERELVTILTPFDTGVIYDNSKFRDKTIDQIQSEYFGDADQYVGTLMISSIRLYGVDKEYMLIRGKTKDMKVRLFLLDSSITEDLKHQIDQF